MNERGWGCKEVYTYFIKLKELHSFFLSTVSTDWTHIDQAVPELYKGAPAFIGGGTVNVCVLVCVCVVCVCVCVCVCDLSPLLWKVEIGEITEAEVVEFLDLLLSHVIRDTLSVVYIIHTVLCNTVHLL